MGGSTLVPLYVDAMCTQCFVVFCRVQCMYEFHCIAGFVNLLHGSIRYIMLYREDLREIYHGMSHVVGL